MAHRPLPPVRGDEERNALVVENLGLAWHAATHLPVDPLDRDDAYSACCLGLIRAASLYKPELGFKFSTYATGWIRKHLRDARMEAAAIWVPKYLRSTKGRANHAERSRLAWELRVINLDGTTDLDCPEDEPDEDIADRQDLLARAWPKVPIESRLILGLYYSLGMTLDGAAKVSGLKRSTFVERLRRAVRYARRAVNEVRREGEPVPPDD